MISQLYTQYIPKRAP